MPGALSHIYRTCQEVAAAPARGGLTERVAVERASEREGENRGAWEVFASPTLWKGFQKTFRGI